MKPDDYFEPPPKRKWEPIDWAAIGFICGVITMWGIMSFVTWMLK